MDQHVVSKTLGRGTGVLAEATTMKFLSLVGPLVNLQTGLVGESIATLVAVQFMIIAMKSSHVNSQVSLSFTGLNANCALKHWHSIDVDISVLLHTVLLTKSGLTNITFVWLFFCVHPDVPLQVKPVCCGVGAIQALKGPLSGVNSYVSLQFGFLNTAVSTLLTLIILLICVFVFHVTI